MTLDRDCAVRDDLILGLEVAFDLDELVLENLPVQDGPPEVTEPAVAQRRVGVRPHVEPFVVLGVRTEASGDPRVVHARNVQHDTDNVKGTARSLLGVGSGRSPDFGTAEREDGS